MLKARFENLMQTIRDNPERPAIITEKQELTFGSLGSRVQALYETIKSQQDGNVLIYGHKELDIVPSMIAAAFAGRGFVFADKTYPAQRIEQVVSTCNCTIALCTGEPAPFTDIYVVKTADVPDSELSDLMLHEDEEELLFYITFTSGSTGVPKGIPVSRANFACFIDWFEPQNTGSAGGDYAHVSHANMAFDMSMSDLWTALFAGRTLYLLDHANNLNPRGNLKQILSNPAAPAGTLTATPAFLSLMLEDAQFNATVLPCLKAFWVGGESVQKALLQRLRTRFHDAEFYHGYGPSEATCVTHCVQLSEEDLTGDDPLPLGTGHPGTRTLVDRGEGVFDTHGEGEIILEGSQVAQGYLPDDHPGNAMFFTHEGRKAYRTGDIGCLDQMGSLQVCGRVDTQVKVNGYRIELGEIERSATQVAGVSIAVALQESKTGSRGIVLIISGEDLTDTHVVDVRNHLKSALPLFMVPSRIVAGQDLPMSLVGKIDRRAVNERFG